MEDKNKIKLSSLKCYRSPFCDNTSILRILPTGLPVYEPSFLWMHNDTNETDDEGMDSDRYVEKRLNRFMLPFRSLHYSLERYLLTMDYTLRMKQLQQDELFAKKEIFVKCQKNKEEALKCLYQIRQLLAFTSLNPTTSQRTFALVPSVQPVSRQAQWIRFVIMLSHRACLYKHLINTIDEQMQLNRVAIADQMVFLRTVNELQPYWSFQKIPYAKHVFERGSDYPYRAELRLDLLNLPWNCWGLNRPCANVEVFKNQEGMDSEVLYESTPAPFLCWPPLPASPPCSPASAEIFFVPSSSTHVHTLPRRLRIQIRWVGDASYCIESNRELRVKIVPTFSSHSSAHPSPSSLTENLVSDLASCQDHEMSKVQMETQHLSNLFTSLTPPLLPIPDHWIPESKELHQRLQKAQWTLVDRAIHLVYQAQAARLKCHLNTVCYGTADEAVWSQSVLDFDENFQSSLAHYEKHVFGSSNSKKSTIPNTTSTSVTNNDSDAKRVSIYQRRVTVDEWQPYMTFVTLRSLPLYSDMTRTFESETSCRQTSTPCFHADFGICVSYEPVSTGHQKSFQNIHHQAAWDSLLNTPPQDKTQKINCLTKLPLAEAVATCYLRHLFLTAWKHTTDQLPEKNFDLNSSTLPSTHGVPGFYIFSKFIDWLENYLAFSLLSKS